MADLKISQLTGATTPLAGTEVLPIVQGGATKQVSVANLTAGRTQTSNGIVQGTAGTGYNFTANTPAAGMTSQLLNWYEEGTWTPTVASGSGSITSYSSSGTYTRVGRQVTITAAITITNNGTGAAYIKVTNLPFTIGGQGASGAVYESAVTGNTCVIQGPNGGKQFNLWTCNNGYPGATGATFNLSLTYIV